MNKSNSLFDKQLIKESLGASVRKLDPRTMIKNPIMFTVEIVTAVMFSTPAAIRPLKPKFSSKAAFRPARLFLRAPLRAFAKPSSCATAIPSVIAARVF